MGLLNRVAGACALAVLLSFNAGGVAAQSAGAAAAGASHWVQTWGAAPLPPSEAFGPFPASPSFSNQTIRQIVRVSLGGRRIRIRFSNEYGGKPLLIGAASVALAGDKGRIQPGTMHPLTFSGSRSVLVPAGAPLLSDPIDLPVATLGSLSISLYVPGDTGPCTCHQTGAQTAYISDTGNFVDSEFTPKSTSQYREFLSGVDVEAGADGRAVVVLADSISDGVGATVDANHRWPDLLANRLDAGGHGRWGVVNMGISGNQLLTDGMGVSALARFDRDVIAVPGVQALIVFIGVNDLGVGFGDVQGAMASKIRNPSADFKLTPEAMIAGYRQLIARAHAHGIRVIGATITPYDGASYYTPQGEVVRQAINTWIRTSHEFDGVLDFDAAWRDPAHPTQIKDGWNIDHLHGNDVGYQVLADSIDLSLLR